MLFIQNLESHIVHYCEFLIAWDGWAVDRTFYLTSSNKSFNLFARTIEWVWKNIQKYEYEVTEYSF